MPEIDIRPLKPNTPNAEILEAIHRNASPDYQRRITEPTKASVQDNLKELTDYRPAWNEFVDALINRIGLVLIKNSVWTNPLAKFKRGMLQWGDTIEEINVGLIKARSYNPDRQYLERDIFGQYPPEVQSSFHKITRQDYYPITINEPLLQRAFLDNSGLQSFTTAAMAAPATSDQWDEYLVTTSLFREYYDNGGFFKVQVDDIGNASSDAPASKAFLRRVREFAGNLQFLSTHYNASGMPVAANPEDLELFITPEALAAIDVEALAGAFHVEKANVPMRITVIPQKDFNIPGAQAILTTREFFVIADSRLETAGVWNPVSLSNNQFFHHWEVISASRFVPAILFTTEESSVITIPDTPVTAISPLLITDEGTTVTKTERGKMYQVVGRAVTEGDNDDLRLELVGALSTHSRVSQAGVLKVAIDEEARKLKVVAYAVDGGLSGEVEFDVVGDRLVLWPNAHVEDDDDKDGLIEVIPAALAKVDGKVTIPNVKGVQYKKAGADVVNGSVHEITASTVFTAVARTGFELAAGAVASWTIA